MQKFQPKNLGLRQVFFLFLPALVLCSGFTTQRQLVKKGNEAFKDKRYKTALQSYEKAQIKNPDSSTIRYNVGNAYYELSEYRNAERAYEKVLTQTRQDKPFLTRTLYNYGNVQYRLGQFDKSIEAYKKVLDMDPQDLDAKYNLEILMEKKKAFDKKDAERKKQQDEKQRQMSQSANGQKPESGGREKREQGNGQRQEQESEQGEGKQGQASKVEGDKQTSQADEQKSEEQKLTQQSATEDESATEQASALKELTKEQSQEEQKREEAIPRQEGKEKGEESGPLREQELSPHELSQLQTQPIAHELTDTKEEGEPQEKGGSLVTSGYQEGGRISSQQALQILNALHESEREVLNFRRPPAKPREKTTDKDW